MNELTSYRTKIGCLGKGVLNLQEPIDCIDAESFLGIITKLYQFTASPKPFLSLYLPGNFEVLVDLRTLKNAGLTDSIIQRIRKSHLLDRFLDLKETFLVRTFKEFSLENLPLLRELSPWTALAEVLTAKIKKLESCPFVLERAEKFFNQAIELRKSLIFSLIRISKVFTLVIGRRGKQGEIFVISKNLESKVIGKGSETIIKKMEVEEISDPSLANFPSRSIAVKKFYGAEKKQVLLEKRGNKSVQNLSDHIIEYLGEVIDDQSHSWNPIGLVFPAYTGEFLRYLEDLLFKSPSLSFEHHYQILTEVFKKIASAVERMHQRDLVHTDIKGENIFLSWTPELEITEVVLADLSNTDPLKKKTIVTSNYTFLEDYLDSTRRESYEKDSCIESDALKRTKKRIDVRQLGFVFYRILSVEKIKKGLFEKTPYPLFIYFDTEWPDWRKSYRDLPSTVPVGLSALIRDMLSLEKVPSIEEVCERLRSL